MPAASFDDRTLDGGVGITVFNLPSVRPHTGTTDPSSVRRIQVPPPTGSSDPVFILPGLVPYRRWFESFFGRLVQYEVLLYEYE